MVRGRPDTVETRNENMMRAVITMYEIDLELEEIILDVLDA